jgi:hypothetical protein
MSVSATVLRIELAETSLRSFALQQNLCVLRQQYYNAGTRKSLMQRDYCTRRKTLQFYEMRAMDRV